jgi:hypothetical protein
VGKLVLKLPDGRTRDIPLDRERITIGRRPDNDVCLPYPAVSGEHAAVLTILDDSFLEDLGSTNGTLVNGKRIAKHFLRDGDEIDVGQQVLVYRDDVSGAARPRPADAAQLPVAPAAARVELAGEAIGEAEWTQSATAAPPGTPTLEIVDGAGAGRRLAIDRDVFVIGRVGLQVVSVSRQPEGWRLAHVEGATPPHVNGAALNADGALLVDGDEIEVAGVRIRFHARG